MKVLPTLACFAISALLVLPFEAFASDEDHPLITRYPGADLRSMLKISHERIVLPVSFVVSDSDLPEKTLSLVGDMTQHFYTIEQTSTLKVFENYLAAFKRENFSVLYQCSMDTCGPDTNAYSHLGAIISPENSVYNYYRNPYYIVAEKNAVKGRVVVAVFMGAYESSVGAQQIVLHEVPLDDSLIKINTEYLVTNEVHEEIVAISAEQKMEDHPMMSRYPGAALRSRQTLDYEAVSFPVGLKFVGGEASIITQKSKGDVYKHFYRIQHVSSLKIAENYRSALKALSFDMLFECGLDECGDQKISAQLGGLISTENNVYNYYRKPYFMVAKGKGPRGDVYVVLYVARYEDETAVQQFVLEVEPLDDSLITVDAESLRRQLDTEGKAQIYGIYFDVDSATMTAESTPALEQIAKLLSTHADLLLYVVGHTDDTGDLENNLSLSQARASAVKAKLVNEYRIAEKRLLSAGVGPYSPEANNTSSLGKKRNRRVELVKRLK